MRQILLLVAAVAVLSVGCDQKPEPPKESSAESGSGVGTVLSAPTDYLGAAANSKKSAVKTIDTMALNNAIQLFGGEQGRYPKDLNELVQKKYLKEIPPVPHGMRIDYDPNSGSVRIVKQ